MTVFDFLHALFPKKEEKVEPVVYENEKFNPDFEYELWQMEKKFIPGTIREFREKIRRLTPTGRWKVVNEPDGSCDVLIECTYPYANRDSIGWYSWWNTELYPIPNETINNCGGEV